MDYLKIDGSFVREIARDKTSYAMVKSINQVGKLRGKKTIAEFVEHKDFLKKLEGIGVDYVQGYAVGRPARFPGNNRITSPYHFWKNPVHRSSLACPSGH